MFKITPDMTPEDVKARFEALSDEEKRTIARSIIAGVNAMVFDFLAVQRVAKSNGRVMPTEVDFVQVFQPDQPQQVH